VREKFFVRSEGISGFPEADFWGVRRIHLSDYRCGTTSLEQRSASQSLSGVVRIGTAFLRIVAAETDAAFLQDKT
jgi:hypothetical protein